MRHLTHTFRSGELVPQDVDALNTLQHEVNERQISVMPPLILVEGAGGVCIGLGQAIPPATDVRNCYVLRPLATQPVTQANQIVLFLGSIQEYAVNQDTGFPALSNGQAPPCWLWNFFGFPDLPLPGDSVPPYQLQQSVPAVWTGLSLTLTDPNDGKVYTRTLYIIVGATTRMFAFLFQPLGAQPHPFTLYEGLLQSVPFGVPPQTNPSFSPGDPNASNCWLWNFTTEYSPNGNLTERLPAGYYAVLPTGMYSRLISPSDGQAHNRPIFALLNGSSFLVSATGGSQGGTFLGVNGITLKPLSAQTNWTITSDGSGHLTIGISGPSGGQAWLDGDGHTQHQILIQNGLITSWF